MLGLSVDVLGGNDLAQRKQNLVGSIVASVEAAGWASVRVLTAAIQEESPVDTGELLRSTGGEVHLFGTIDQPTSLVLMTQPAQNDEGKFYSWWLTHGWHMWVFGHDTGVFHEPLPYIDDAVEHSATALRAEVATAVRRTVTVLE